VAPEPSLLPQEGKEKTNQYADLPDPEDKHPLDEIGPQVMHFCSQFAHLSEQFYSQLAHLFRQFYSQFTDLFGKPPLKTFFYDSDDCPPLFLLEWVIAYLFFDCSTVEKYLTTCSSPQDNAGTQGKV